MGQGKDDVNSKLFRIRGILRTGSTTADGVLAIITVGAAQEFLEQPGSASQISVHLPVDNDSEDALAAVTAALPDRGDLEILGWKEAVAEVYGFTQTDRRTNNSLMFLIGLIVALGIINTILMSVMERIREFGVMLALGIPPVRLRGMILTEGLFLGILGAALGFAIGGAVTAWLIRRGIDFAAMMGGASIEMAGVSVSTVVYPEWDWVSMGAYASVAVVLSVLATIYPAWKAGALRPVEAMRHV
jgi:ABC-type lipoprotein release transport system permease subunit